MILFSWSWACLCQQLWGHNVSRTLVLNRPDWCYAMRFIRHKLMVNNTVKLMFAKFLRPWECRVSSCLLHELWGLLNVIRKWVAITAAYGWKSMSRDLIAQDWDLLLRRWRDISVPSRCFGIHYRLARHKCDLITGMPEHRNEKREQNR